MHPSTKNIDINQPAKFYILRFHDLEQSAICRASYWTSSIAECAWKLVFVNSDEHHLAPSRSFRESGAVYKWHNLLTYLFTYLHTEPAQTWVSSPSPAVLRWGPPRTFVVTSTSLYPFPSPFLVHIRDARIYIRGQIFCGYPQFPTDTDRIRISDFKTHTGTDRIRISIWRKAIFYQIRKTLGVVRPVAL